MFYSYDINEESIYNYNNIFCKKINKPKNKLLILNFSLLIFFTFSIVSYFSITPAFIFLYKKSNYLFIISLMISIVLTYIIVRQFLKCSNYTQITSQGIILNNFYKNGYRVKCRCCI